jgi:Glycosyltransferase family 87
LLYFFNRRFVDDTSLRTGRFAAAFAFLSLIYQPIWTAFRTGGQTTPMVFFLLVLSLLATVSSRPFLSALAFGSAVMIKPALITAIAFFAIVAGMKYLKYVFYIFLGTGLLSIAVAGWQVHERFLMLMLTGVSRSVPWFYNSGLYVTFENLKLFAPPGSWPKTYESVLNALKIVIKLSVFATIVFIVCKGRRREWTGAARNHFNFLMAICFFSLLGHIVYEAYLSFLFIVLAYLVASIRRFAPSARLLVGTIFCLSFWQNVMWMDFLRYFFDLDSVPELIAIGLFKSGPLILLLVLLARHHEDLFESYHAEAWKRG